MKYEARELPHVMALRARAAVTCLPADQLTVCQGTPRFVSVVGTGCRWPTAGECQPMRRSSGMSKNGTCAAVRGKVTGLMAKRGWSSDTGLTVEGVG